MKRLNIILITFLLFLSSSAFTAEHAFDNGAVRIGGNISFLRQTDEAYQDVSILFVKPSISCAISDGLFAGVITQIEKYYYRGNNSKTNWAIGPIIEIYISPDKPDKIIKNVIPYFKFFFTKGNNDGLDFQSAGINLGFLKMLNQHIGLDFSLSYSFDKLEVKNYYYNYDPYNHYYYDYIQIDDLTGEKLTVGIGIESFIF